jgi:hypothetical protein
MSNRWSVLHWRGHDPVVSLEAAQVRHELLTRPPFTNKRDSTVEYLYNNLLSPEADCTSITSTNSAFARRLLPRNYARFRHPRGYYALTPTHFGTSRATLLGHKDQRNFVLHVPNGTGFQERPKLFLITAIDRHETRAQVVATKERILNGLM